MAIIIGHVVLATIGAGLLTRVLWNMLLPVFRVLGYGGRVLYWMSLSSFFPVQFCLGAALGYLYSRLFPEKWAAFVCAPPALWFVLRWGTFQADESLLSSTSFSAKWDHFFGQVCLPPHCYDQVLFVLPLISAIGYTLGIVLQRVGVFTFSRPDAPEGSA